MEQSFSTEAETVDSTVKLMLASGGVESRARYKRARRLKNK